MNPEHSLKLSYTGEELDKAIEETCFERKALIENFIYEHSALLIFADDGIGKSVISLQAMMQATVADSKVFGEFFVSKSCKVLYFQMERAKDESFERMRHLKKVIPYDSKNFLLSLALQGVNLQEKSDFKESLDIIDKLIIDHNFFPDIIVFDPIYALVQDDLAEAKPCNSISRFFRLLQAMYNTSIFCTSHTNRGVRQLDGTRAGKDMYGNRFLSAFFTGSYHVTAKGDGEGTIFKREKNSNANLEKSFELIYDPTTYLSWSASEGKYTKKDRLLNFIKACKTQDKEFSFEEMQEKSELSDSTLRGYLTGELKNSVIFSRKIGKNKNLYKYL